MIAPPGLAAAIVLVSSIFGVFSLGERDAVLASTQVAGLARQVPVLLATLALSSVGLAYTHHGIAPDGLTIWPLCCLLTICLVRLVTWVRMQRQPIEGPAALRRLRGTNVATAVLAGGFSAWAMALTAYGDSGAQIHVIFFLAITMIVCLQCLMHLRFAAVIVATCAIPAVA